ncbi:MAG: hypothetical protein WAN17_07070 [Candidatus Sulfotelmatobacter sp.]
MTRYGEKILKFVTGLGCLVSIAGPLLATVLYPRAKWLFALAVIGIAIVILAERTRKDPTPAALVDEIENLLTGNYGGWDVDGFEHRGIRNPTLREYYLKSMSIGGLPETWVRMTDAEKEQMREIIRQLRRLPDDLGK